MLRNAPVYRGVSILCLGAYLRFNMDGDGDPSCREDDFPSSRAGRFFDRARDDWDKDADMFFSTSPRSNTWGFPRRTMHRDPEMDDLRAQMKFPGGRMRGQSFSGGERQGSAATAPSTSPAPSRGADTGRERIIPIQVEAGCAERVASPAARRNTESARSHTPAAAAAAAAAVGDPIRDRASSCPPARPRGSGHVQRSSTDGAARVAGDSTFPAPAPSPGPAHEPPAAPQLPPITARQRALSRIAAVQEPVTSLQELVAQFEGQKGDKQFLYLDEMLTRQLLVLDDVDPDGDEQVRSARKAVIVLIQRALAHLEQRGARTAAQEGKVEEVAEGKDALSDAGQQAEASVEQSAMDTREGAGDQKQVGEVQQQHSNEGAETVEGSDGGAGDPAGVEGQKSDVPADGQTRLQEPVSGSGVVDDAVSGPGGRPDQPVDRGEVSSGATPGDGQQVGGGS